MAETKEKILIIGAGPAGLTSGLLLTQKGYDVTIFESHPQHVGGLSKTVLKNGFRFDIGGHRFYTKDKEVREFWKEVLPEQFMRRKRISRIYYNGKFFNYPIKPLDVFTKMNPLTTIQILGSYLRSSFLSKKKIDPNKNFENWIISNFGTKLYSIFFKSYTEKVWGIPCDQLSADWASQRINNLNIMTLAKDILSQVFKRRNNDVKSLIEEFNYPMYGPGMFWEKVAKDFQALGGDLYLNAKVEKISHTTKKPYQWFVQTTASTKNYRFDRIINTAPLKVLFQALSPKPVHLINQINKLNYRGFITVAIMFKGPSGFPDNWIYIHDRRVKVARIQNYKNWSPHMVPDPEHTCYGLEYFCSPGDAFWRQSDQELYEIALNDLKTLQLSFNEKVNQFHIERCPYAYPVYDLDYKKRIDVIRRALDHYSNLHSIGRNGQHRYNNQDHSIKTAMLLVEDITDHSSNKDFWSVNQDAEYLETQS